MSDPYGIIRIYRKGGRINYDEFEGDYDSDEYRELEIEDMHNTGELIATRHLLSVAIDIINNDHQGKGY